MIRRKWLIVFLLFLISTTTVFARQNPPDQINAALRDLSQRYGATLTLGSFASWNWSQQVYPDASLGCPQPGQAYAQQQTLGYDFTFVTYDGITYDYRVSGDQTIVILCSPTTVPVGQPPATLGAATIAPPVNGSGPVNAFPCPGTQTGSVASHLAVGFRGIATASINLNMRAQPNRNSIVAGIIRPGDPFTVIGGPSCGEGFVWWQIASSLASGWTPEINPDDLSYWLQPVSGGTQPVQPSAPTGNLAAITSINGSRIVRASSVPLSFTPTFIAASPVNNLLAVNGSTGLHLYVPMADQPPWQVGGPTSSFGAMTFNAAGTVLAVATADSSTHQSLVTLWDTQQATLNASTNGVLGSEPASFAVNIEAVVGIAFNSAGNILAVGGNSSGSQGVVNLYNMSVMDSPGANPLILSLSQGQPVAGFALSPAANPLAVVTLDGSVRFWDTSAANEIAAFPSMGGSVGPGSTATASMSANGALVATSSNSTLQLWDFASRTLRGNPAIPTGMPQVIGSVFSPDGSVLAVSTQVPQVPTSTVYLFDTLTGALLGSVPAGGNTALAFSSNGLLNVIYVGQNGGGMWDIYGGQ